MMINIENVVSSTWIFGVILGLFLALSIRRDKSRNLFPISTTEELKGFAVLAVIFAHIGYFLVYDHRFLYPLSIVAGVAVDLFLFLSGFGLTVSSLKKGISISKFYFRRLPRLFIPLWIILVIFFTLDFFVLKISYPWQYIAKSFFGLFNSADVFQDVNSPLWYFSIILFYYLIYPLVFIKKSPWISAIVIFITSYLFVFQLNFGLISKVISLYQAHLIAFPLGMCLGWAYQERKLFSDRFHKVISKYKAKNKKLFNLVNKIVNIPSVKRFEKNILTSFRYLIMALLSMIIVYTAVNSGVGNLKIVTYISIVTTLSIFTLFILKKFDFKFLILFGVYSYEIYLLHWPIMSRYDIFYRHLPAWLATIFYLAFFLILAWILHKLTDRILKRKINNV